MGGLGIVFFGGCTVIGFAELRSPARVTIDNDCMLDHWWRHWTYELSRCGEFQVFATGRISKVVFDYDGPTPAERMGRLNRSVGLPKAGLPPLEMPATELADLLNERRTGHAG